MPFSTSYLKWWWSRFCSRSCNSTKQNLLHICTPKCFTNVLQPYFKLSFRSVHQNCSLINGTKFMDSPQTPLPSLSNSWTRILHQESARSISPTFLLHRLACSKSYTMVRPRLVDNPLKVRLADFVKIIYWPDFSHVNTFVYAFHQTGREHPWRKWEWRRWRCDKRGIY